MSTVVLASRVDRVIAHPTCARVARRADLPTHSGALIVRIMDLPLLLRSGSLRVQVEGGGGTLLRVDEVADLDVQADHGPDVDLEALEAEVEAAEQAVRRLVAEQQALESVIGVLEQPLDAEVDLDEHRIDGTALAGVADACERVVDDFEHRRQQRRVDLRAVHRTLDLAVKRRDSARSGGRVRAVRGIEVAVQLDGTPHQCLRIDYFVDGVRWAPGYSLAVDGDSARLVLSARIAQATGEPWHDAALALSTVQPHRTAALPKLSAWRIGRTGAAASTGWRPLPSDLPTLFRGVDGVGKPPRPRTSPDTRRRQRLDRAIDPLIALGEDVLSKPGPAPFALTEGALSPPAPEADDPLDRAPPMPAKPVRARPAPPIARPAAPVGGPPVPSAAPQRSASMAMAGGAPPGARPRAKRRGRAAAAAPPVVPRPPDPGQLLDYGWLRLPPWSDRARRGGLHPVTLQSSLPELVEARGLGAGTVRSIGQALDNLRSSQSRLARAGLPGGFTDSAAAGFHHRTPFGPRVTLPADAQFRGVQVWSAAAPVRRVYRVVPRQDTAVQEMLELDSPFDGPLATGPLRVSEHGGVRASTTLPAVGAGGRLRVSIGPEERLRVARNADMQEETRGMLGGERVLVHRITLTIANRMTTAAQIEVFEALPDGSADSGVEVRLDPSEPPPERGPDPHGARDERALRWQVTVPAGEERRIRWGYSITISSRAELEGGNRREP